MLWGGAQKKRESKKKKKKKKKSKTSKKKRKKTEKKNEENGHAILPESLGVGEKQRIASKKRGTQEKRILG